MGKFPKPKPYNYMLQVANMASNFPQFSSTKTEYGYDFIGTLKPRETEYLVKIMYRKKLDPKVFVISPEIIRKRHRYEDLSLCIYKQTKFIWREDRLISKYIVPLTVMWLHFYEVYVETGFWYGPEAQHDTDEVKQIIDIK